ncbi:cystatin-A-like [Toxotes jaculatrix]|uniref:cystatin-A-like n=1 Tax=Toxotes jaculatrix TaxID=941984 RepID=UPI001B3A829B|nr:cystatin-A-like [Toxotes jaculatrix]
MANMPGGWTEVQDATEEIQRICDHVKNQVQEKTKEIYEEFQSVKYKSQVVHGVNYLIKVQVGGCRYLYLAVFQELACDGGEIVLNSVCGCDTSVPF